MRRSFALFGFVGGAAVVACSGFSSSTEGGPDGGTAIGMEAGIEAGIESRIDSGIEPGMDAGVAVGRLDGGAVCPDGGPCKHVFVSAKSYSAKMTSGDKVGIAAADDLCALEAVAAGFAGTWGAWISEGTNFAITRVAATAPYYLVDGTYALSTKSGQPDVAHAINLDPFGVMVSDEFAWTSTDGSGVALNDVATSVSCASWTSVEHQHRGGVGATSPTTLATQEWSLAQTLPCDRPLRLFCFQTK